jgi:two-component system, OmpR family, phosphate regulon sensor histidine kinase PhoR
MLLNPRVLAFLLGISIAVLTTVCLAFIPSLHVGVLFVNFFVTLIISGILVFYTLDVMIFQEVNKMLDTISQLRITDISLSRKKIIKQTNPLKKLNTDLFSYVARTEREVNELKELARYRREFLADVSHELKTPIFSAQGFIHTLLDGAMDDEGVREKFLQKAAKNLDGLEILVRDLITVSQVESGEIKMNFGNVDLQEIVKYTFEQLEAKAKSKNVKLSLKINSQSFQTIAKADSQRIGQVLTNLVDNAIKYGNENGKVVVLFEETKKHWQVSVRDDGPGIAPEHLGRIFERFYRIDKSRSKESGGTGLGLSIVKHLVNAHGSQIAVTSKPDKGTSFVFRLLKGE